MALFRVFFFNEYSYRYLLESMVGSLLLLDWIGLALYSYFCWSGLYWRCIVIFVFVLDEYIAQYLPDPMLGSLLLFNWNDWIWIDFCF